MSVDGTVTVPRLVSGGSGPVAGPVSGGRGTGAGKVAVMGVVIVAADPPSSSSATAYARAPAPSPSTATAPARIGHAAAAAAQARREGGGGAALQAVGLVVLELGPADLAAGDRRRRALAVGGRLAAPAARVARGLREPALGALPAGGALLAHGAGGVGMAAVT